MKVSIPFRCPLCGNEIPREEMPAFATTPIKCPTCSGKLQYAAWQPFVGTVIALVITIAICWWFGLRGWLLLIGTVLFWLPVLAVVGFAVHCIIPQHLEPYKPKNTDPFDSDLSIR